jgi:hypothetical protein
LSGRPKASPELLFNQSKAESNGLAANDIRVVYLGIPARLAHVRAASLSKTFGMGISLSSVCYLSVSELCEDAYYLRGQCSLSESLALNSFPKACWLCRDIGENDINGAKCVRVFVK